MKDDYELTIKDGRNQGISFTIVPKAGIDKSYNNSREWLGIAIKINGSATRVANHMFRDYKGSAIAAADKRGVLMYKPMNGTQYASMLQAGNINGKKQEVIAQAPMVEDTAQKTSYFKIS